MQFVIYQSVHLFNKLPYYRTTTIVLQSATTPVTPDWWHVRKTVANSFGPKVPKEHIPEETSGMGGAYGEYLGVQGRGHSKFLKRNGNFGKGVRRSVPPSVLSFLNPPFVSNL